MLKQNENQIELYMEYVLVPTEVDPTPILQKGGDPAAPSGTATLLRLSPSYWSHLWSLLTRLLWVLPTSMA